MCLCVNVGCVKKMEELNVKLIDGASGVMISQVSASRVIDELNLKQVGTNSCFLLIESTEASIKVEEITKHIKCGYFPLTQVSSFCLTLFCVCFCLTLF